MHAECDRMKKRMCHYSKEFGYYNCVTILTMQFYECRDEKNSCGGSWYLNPSHKFFFTNTRLFEKGIQATVVTCILFLQCSNLFYSVVTCILFLIWRSSVLPRHKPVLMRMVGNNRVKWSLAVEALNHWMALCPLYIQFEGRKTQSLRYEIDIVAEHDVEIHNPAVPHSHFMATPTSVSQHCGSVKIKFQALITLRRWYIFYFMDNAHSKPPPQTKLLLFTF